MHGVASVLAPEPYRPVEALWDAPNPLHAPDAGAASRDVFSFQRDVTC